MAKARPKAAAGKTKTAVLAAQMKAKAKKPNPFELKGTKGHFDTIGKRVSGKKKNVIQARQEAVNRRKKTLLVEYRQLRKANTFVDRRFGESNPELTETQKGIARLQVQRMKEERKKKKRSSKFTLSEGNDGGDGEGLTHLGRSLADDIRGFMDRPEFDDLDEEMVEEMVSQYHFGGGQGEGGDEAAERHQGGGGGGEGDVPRGPDGKPKTRKQIMEEIIAKSRMYKALKAKQREEDEAALESINAEFTELMRSAALMRFVKAPGENKGVKVKTDNAEDAAYDVAARELAFESKGAAGDRTLSPEELLEKERLRLEKLEKERLKRMRGGDGDGDGDDDDEEGEEDDGRRKRRREMPSGDALCDDYESDGGEDEEADDGDEASDGGREDDDEDASDGAGGANGKKVSELDKRRMKAAAGNHPLQESFRAAAAALAKKYGVKTPKNPYLDSEGEEEGEEEDGEGESSSDGEVEEEEEDGEGESSSDGEVEEEEDGSGDDDHNGEEEDADEDGDMAEMLEQRRKPANPPSTSQPGHADVVKAQTCRTVPSAAVPKKASVKPLEGPIDLPYTIPLPSSYNEFAGLVSGRPAEDLHSAIARIRAFNAVALSTDNKRKMQEFYGILVQHFVMEAGKSPLPVLSLDVLTRVLLELTPEIPYYAATVARARLGRMCEQLTAALVTLGGAAARQAAGVTDAAFVTPTSPWPTARVALQLKLFAMLFPTSDRRHPVLTPAALLIGKYLNQCVVSNPREAAVGLFLCGLLMHMAAPAHRTTPEVLVFLRDCLAAFLSREGEDKVHGKASDNIDGCGADTREPVSPAVKRKGGDGNAATADDSGKVAQSSHERQGDADVFVRFPAGLFTLGGKGWTAVDSPPAPPPLDLYGTLGMSDSDPRVSSDEFKLGMLRIALCAVRRAATLASESSLMCFEQLFAPLRSVVSQLVRIERKLPEELRGLRATVLKQLSDASSSCVASRRPLVHAARARASAAAAGVVPPTAVREFNPRFEDGFVSSRDYDPDRQRVEARRLKRALVKERRGAIRELRRDAVFMAEERDRETARVDAERLESERRFYSELQHQAADLRSGGQGGMNPHLKRKKR